VDVTAWAAVTAAFTVSEKVLLAVAPLLSVTVTVKVAAESVAVGVFEIAPVAELKFNPVGKAGEML
jgi:hypothetical protein